MRPITTFAITLLLVSSCATPPPAPVVAPVAPPPPPPVAEETVSHTVTVKATALNVRREPSADAELIEQVKKGTVLGVVRVEEGWVRVKLDSGEVGWVAERFVERAGEKKSAKKTKCPADSDFAFEKTPMLVFSDSGAHGLVVVDATVNIKGVVTATKVMSNATGDEALAFLAVREIQSARFDPPIRSCVPRAFIFTYRRNF